MDVFVDIYFIWYKTEEKQGLEDCCTKLQKGRGWGCLPFQILVSTCALKNTNYCHGREICHKISHEA